MISVIIPTLNEAHRLPALLAALAPDQHPGVEREVIIVDGGSTDGTRAQAIEDGADRVITAPPGRGQQLREGAAAARGEILLFLHADSVFPAGGLHAIEAVLAADRGLVGGNFRLLFDGKTWFAWWLNGFYIFLRSIRWYYGDSGIFVRRPVYDRVGGMPAIALMEDYAFVARLEAAGRTCCIKDPALITSSRRFEGRNPIAIVWGWVWLHALYFLGTSPDRLARLYDSGRKRTGQ